MGSRKKSSRKASKRKQAVPKGKKGLVDAQDASVVGALLPQEGLGDLHMRDVQGTQGTQPTYLEQRNARTLSDFERLAGRELTSMVEIVEGMALDDGAFGLHELPATVVRDMIQRWTSHLSGIVHAEAPCEEVPRAFMVRMLADGSLILKAVPLPRGIVLASSFSSSEQGEGLSSAPVAPVTPPSVTSPALPAPGPGSVVSTPSSNSVQKSANPNSPKAARTLRVGPGGVVQVEE